MPLHPCLPWYATEREHHRSGNFHVNSSHEIFLQFRSIRESFFDGWLLQYGCLLGWACMSEPHTSVTALHTCMCMYMYVCPSVCGHIPKILNDRIWSLILRRLNSVWSWSLKAESAASVIWSWDDWSWSTNGNLLPTAGCPQAVQIRSRRWLRSLQVRAMHKRHL